MASYSLVAQNQLDAIAAIQTELLERIKSGSVRYDASELATYFTLIDKALGLFQILPQGTAEEQANVTVNKLISLILDEPQGELSMPIDQARFDAAVAKLNELKIEAADDEANKTALAQAQADLKSAQDAVAPLQAKVAELQPKADDDDAARAQLTQAQADLKSAQDALAAAEAKTNQLIDQIVPPETPAQ